MATRVSSARFVGRAAELAELRSALAEAVAGRPALAFVAGESGVGKTRLVCELERGARADGVRVLSGECVDLGEGELAFAPIVAALRPLARAQDPVLDGLPALQSMLPGLAAEAAERGFSEEATGARAQLFEALLTLIDRLGADGGLLLTIEDLHWADRSTRSFLTYLASSLLSERVLVVATYRADELHRRHPLRPVLAELERSARRVDLSPFTAVELNEQLTDILGSPPDQGLLTRLHARSEGNALYAEELLAAGLDGRGSLPPTLREALMLRVERLAAPTQEVLRTLAIAGRIDHAVLAEATQMEARELREALRDGVAAQIVKTDTEGRYALRHALLAEVIADDLLPGERADVHLSLALALESHVAPGAHNASAIAHHYAASGNQPKALVAAVQAADAAEAVHAYGEAAALFERALELWDRVPDAEALSGASRISLLRAAAWCHQVEGEADRAESLLRSAVSLLDEDEEPLLLASVLERLARQLWRLGRQDEAAETLGRALALTPADRPTEERAGVLATQAKHLMLESRYRECVEVAEQALEMARAAGAILPEINALDALGVSLTWRGDDAGIEMLRGAIELACKRDKAMTALTIYANLADVLLLAGRGDEAMTVVDEGLAMASDLGHFSRWLSLMKAETAFAVGDWAVARELLPEHGRRLSQHMFVNEAHRLVAFDLADARHDDARARLEAAAEMIGAREPQFIGPQAALTAELERRTGDLAAARAAVDDGLDQIEFCSEDRARISAISLVGLHVEADAAVRARDLGDTDAERMATMAAEMLLARLEATAGEHRPVEHANLVTGEALMTRTRGEDDPEAWADAVAAWQAAGRPYEAAQARWREAEALLSSGERDAAAETARRALTAARELGAAWLHSEVEGFVARARLRGEDGGGRESSSDDPFGLTPRERQVLELLASGATNREIGAALYMAEKTASVHVSRILAKLDVRTRTEAAAVAHRLGLT